MTFICSFLQSRFIFNHLYLFHYCGVFLSFAPTCFFTSYPQLEFFPLFYHFCSNLLLHFLSAIGAISSILSLLLQFASSLSVCNWSSFLYFIIFTPTCSSSFCLQLEFFNYFLTSTPTSLFTYDLRLELFLFFLIFTPIHFSASCSQLVHFFFFHYICTNPLFYFPFTIGAFLLFFLRLHQSAFLLPAHNWSISSFFLIFAPIRFFTSCSQLEHFFFFSYICSNPLLRFLSAIGVF